MDIELAKTFLEVVSAGSFIRASERLHITQTAVTARIRTLEELLESQLFVRNRSGARLTPEGETFVAHATDLVNIWNRARREMHLPKGHKARLRLGGETSLWNPLLSNWVAWIQTDLPDVAVDSQVDDPALLIAALERGQLDAAIVHRPNYYSGFIVEQLLEEKLIQVQKPGNGSPNLFINWGEDFVRQYDASLPQPRQSAFSFNLGPLALQLLLRNGGNGWFRTRVVEQYLASGELERVTGSPEFTYPVYITYRAAAAAPSLEPALQGLRQIAALDMPWQV
ncbi:MAG TPA: LysR family transcriptional regulator [Dongiaceae bacterium]|nr:LysR family transcriptional regulator [Dongiaceae bacterium]